MDFIFQWIDVVWLPLGLAVVHKAQRPVAAAFFIGSMVMMRLLIEMMGAIGYPYGLIGLMDLSVQKRGLITYSVFYLLYIILLYISPRVFRPVLLGASITVFFIAAMSFCFIMVL